MWHNSVKAQLLAFIVSLFMSLHKVDTSQHVNGLIILKRGSHEEEQEESNGEILRLLLESVVLGENSGEATLSSTAFNAW